MVHALEECRRVLARGGLFIDLRPYAGNWPLAVVADGRVWPVGRMDGRVRRPTDRACDAALRRAVRAGLFRPVRATTFPFAWYWDSLAEMEAYLADRWTDVMALPPATRAAAVATLAAAGPDARLRILRGMRLAVYRPVGASSQV
jgi:hypothetical protein